MRADILTQKLTEDTGIKSLMERDYWYSFTKSLDGDKTVGPEPY